MGQPAPWFPEYARETSLSRAGFPAGDREKGQHPSIPNAIKSRAFSSTWPEATGRPAVIFFR